MNFAREEQKNIEASHRDDISYENVDNLFRKVQVPNNLDQKV